MRKTPPAATPVPAPRRRAATVAAVQAPDQDFRSRVAAEKRERMRERLVEATLQAYAGSTPGLRPVIDDVVRVAGVSRGSFYKYFDSIEEILPELGQRMADDMVDTFQRLFGDIADPAVRIAVGPLLSLCRSAMDPTHVACTASVDFGAYFATGRLHGMVVTDQLLAARQAGVLHFESLEAAIDLAIGASMEGSRRVQRLPRLDAAYATALARGVLCGLGMTRAAARRAADQAWQLLMQRCATLPWWRPAQIQAADGAPAEPLR
ncbi:TetR/AcrR family transcriptional regulator [Pseudorhodoferax sp. LjRoot39]|uniref:TetR/AcrR family transcriptional regulator n=1 Tax=Pseudorhodoferax sp. LjRoot39 TaxID=3342328 RepID=UPI003ECFBE3F